MIIQLKQNKKEQRSNISISTELFEKSEMGIEFRLSVKDAHDVEKAFGYVLHNIDVNKMNNEEAEQWVKMLDVMLLFGDAVSKEWSKLLNNRKRQ